MKSERTRKKNTQKYFFVPILIDNMFVRWVHYTSSILRSKKTHLGRKARTHVMSLGHYLQHAMKVLLKTIYKDSHFWITE